MKTKSERHMERKRQRLDKEVEANLKTIYNNTREQRIPKIREKIITKDRSSASRSLSPRIPISYSNSIRPMTRSELNENSLLNSTLQDSSIDTISTVEWKAP